MAASETSAGGTTPATGSGDIGRDLAQLRDDFMRLSETVTGMVRGGAGVGEHMQNAAMSARDAFDEVSGSLSRAGSGMVEDTSARLRTLGQELDDTFQKSPMMGVFAAAGLGMILGMLTRR
jgi:ElaB/YqjD/DUF883 family membrane-anchored ribosome-binding protein